jgi:hypothetical protein
MKKITLLMWSGAEYKIIIALFWFLGFAYPTKAQLVEENQITSLMDRWVRYNETHQELRGYRIQILASTDRRQAETERKKFENTYSEYPILFVHNYPYYHLKVGAFMTMQKAQAFLYKMQQDFPQAIPVTDNLTMEELLEFDQ